MIAQGYSPGWGLAVDLDAGFDRRRAGLAVAEEAVVCRHTPEGRSWRLLPAPERDVAGRACCCGKVVVAAVLAHKQVAGRVCCGGKWACGDGHVGSLTALLVGVRRQDLRYA